MLRFFSRMRIEIGDSRCFVQQPSSTHPIRNYALVDAKPFCAFFGEHQFAIDFYKKVIASISALLGASGPTAVFFGVISLVINPIKLMLFGRSIAHVGKECLERMFPFIANRYSSAAVIAEACGFRVHAPGAHCCPDSVLYRPRFPVSASVTLSKVSKLKNVLSRALTAQAAARLGISTSDSVKRNILLLSANASTDNHLGFSMGVWKGANNCKSSVSQTRQSRCVFHKNGNYIHNHSFSISTNIQRSIL